MNISGDIKPPLWRFKFVEILFALSILILLGRAAQMQLFDHEFYASKAQFERIVELPVTRGSIFERNGIVIAASLPVESLYASTSELYLDERGLRELAQLLGLDTESLRKLLATQREFVCIKRNISRELLQQVEMLKIRGLKTIKDFKRDYPGGQELEGIIGHVDADGNGIDGMENYFDAHLKAKSGRRRIVKDRLGQTVEEIEIVDPVLFGRDIRLSLDIRWQLVAERVVADATKIEASIILIDALSGDILALATNVGPKKGVREPHGHPAVSRLFEPGLVIAPFVIAAGLQKGLFTLSTRLPTANPALLAMTGEGQPAVTETVRVSDMIAKRARFGVAGAGMHLRPSDLHSMLTSIGFGHKTAAGLPKERDGELLGWDRWRTQDHAMIASGRRFSVTLVQVAQAYTALAHNGILPSLSITQRPSEHTSMRVIDKNVVQSIIGALRTERSPAHFVKPVPPPVIVSDSADITSLRFGLTEKRAMAVAAGFSGTERPIAGAILLEVPFAQREEIEKTGRFMLATVLRAGADLVAKHPTLP